MYVKIRRDGAIGLGRGTSGAEEITLGYGEAHMIAAALDKLAQTARSYKQTYKKTTDVGKGNKIDFERTESGSIIIAGDGNRYICTEKQVKEISEVLKNLPPVEVASASDFVKKVKPNQGICLIIENGGSSVGLQLHEAALLKTSLESSIDGKFFHEKIKIGSRVLTINRSSNLKWKISLGDSEVKFTAFEIEGLVQGLHIGVLDVLMDLVKSFGSDSLSDIRVKSHIQRVEQETAKLFDSDKNSSKGIAKALTKSTKKILGTGEDADSRTIEFIDACNFVHANVDPTLHEQIFQLFSSVFVKE